MAILDVDQNRTVVRNTSSKVEDIGSIKPVNPIVGSKHFYPGKNFINAYLVVSLREGRTTKSQIY